MAGILSLKPHKKQLEVILCCLVLRGFHVFHPQTVCIFLQKKKEKILFNLLGFIKFSTADVFSCCSGCEGLGGGCALPISCSNLGGAGIWMK